MLDKEKIYKNLRAHNKAVRSGSLKKLIKLENVSQDLKPVAKEMAPLHFITDEDYSIYSPTMCAYLAHRSGCFAVAINDYATLAGAKEFRKACRILKMPYSHGYHVECEPLFGETQGVMYGYGIPYEYTKEVNAFLQTERQRKLKRVKYIIREINSMLEKTGLHIDEGVINRHLKGGKDRVVTEKIIARTLAEIIVETRGRGEELFEFLNKTLKIDGCECEIRYLREEENSYFTADVAKVIYKNYRLLKSDKKAGKSADYIALNNKCGAISSYKLNVTDNIKKDLCKVADKLLESGFNAVTIKVNDLSGQEFDEIANYFYQKGILTIPLYRLGLPRQLMPTCEVSPIAFKNSLAVIGNSISVYCDKNDGLFSSQTVKRCPDFVKRVELFANVGRKGR